MKLTRIACHLFLLAGILFLILQLIPRGARLDYTICPTTAVVIDWTYYALLIPFLVLLVLANNRFRANEEPQRNPSTDEQILELNIYIGLMMVVCAVFIWRRFRYLDFIPFGIPPEMLLRMAEGSSYREAILGPGWQRQSSYNTGIQMIWENWAYFFGWTIHSYKLMYAMFSCIIIGFVCALFTLEYKPRIATAGGLLLMVSSSMYLGLAYQMKWQTFIPLVMVLIAGMYYLGEKLSRKWHIAALFTAAASMMLYAGNVIHLITLLACYTWLYFTRKGKSGQQSKPFHRWIIILMLILIPGIAVIFLTSVQVTKDFNCLEYFLFLMSSYNTTAAIQSVFREILGRGFSCLGAIVYCLGMIEMIRGWKKTINRLMLTYLFTTSLLLIPTYGYAFYVENNMIAGLIVWILALGGTRFLDIPYQFLMSFYPARKISVRTDTSIRLLLSLIVFVPFLMCEETVFWRYTIDRVLPDPGKKEFQTIAAIEDAMPLLNLNNTSVYMYRSNVKSVFNLCDWNFYKCFDEFKHLNQVVSINSIEELKNLPNQDTGNLKIVYCRNSARTRKLIVEELANTSYLLEEAPCRREPWATRHRGTGALKITLLPYNMQWSGVDDGISAEETDIAFQKNKGCPILRLPEQ